MADQGRNPLYERYLSRHFAHVSDQSRYRERKVAYYTHNYLRHLPASRETCFLDIGPGYGEFIELLQRQGYRSIHAVDISPEVAEFCNGVVPASTLAVADTTAYLLSRPGAFDVISMFHILEHVPKAESLALLTAVHAALRPGGRLIIEVPNMANPVIGMNVRYADFTHEVGFTELSLRYVLEMSGFSQVQPFETALSPDRWERAPQRLVKLLFESGVRLIYRAYGQAAPRVLGRSVSAVAQR